MSANPQEKDLAIDFLLIFLLGFTSPFFLWFSNFSRVFLSPNMFVSKNI